MAARAGIVAIPINYRLATGDPDHRWPAQLKDAEAATAWICRHAGQLGIDPSRLCALRYSAGAHLAVFLAVLGHVSCAVDQFGPVNLQDFRMPTGNLFGQLPPAVLSESERAASPLFLVGKDTPPIMIGHGDRLDVPISQSKELDPQLRQFSVAVELITYDGGHEFHGLAPEERNVIWRRELQFVKAAKPRYEGLGESGGAAAIRGNKVASPRPSSSP